MAICASSPSRSVTSGAVEERTRRAGARRRSSGQGHALWISADGFRLVAEGRAELKKIARGCGAKYRPPRACFGWPPIPALRPAQTEQPCPRRRSPVPARASLRQRMDRRPLGASGFRRPGGPKDRAGLCSSNRCLRRRRTCWPPRPTASQRCARRARSTSFGRRLVDRCRAGLVRTRAAMARFRPGAGRFRRAFRSRARGVPASTRSGGDGRLVGRGQFLGATPQSNAWSGEGGLGAGRGSSAAGGWVRCVRGSKPRARRSR